MSITRYMGEMTDNPFGLSPSAIDAFIVESSFKIRP
jgi:hypothetical protein